MFNIFIITLVSCYLLLIGFLCYTALKPVYKQLPKLFLITLTPLLVFWLIDIFVRCTLGTLIFLELPTKDTLTVTDLCNSHCGDINGYSFKDYKRAIGRKMCGVLCTIQNDHCPAFK